MDLAAINAELKDKSPVDIVRWAVELGKKTLVTTNFGPHEAVILHACAQVDPNMSVVWIDSGYNTPQTYKFAEALIKQLDLKVIPYVPQQTRAHREVVMNGIPEIDTDMHDEFTKQVKLEPFGRAMAEQAPEVWLTAIRKEQTAFRANLDIVTEANDGTLKVAPVFYMSETEMGAYLEANGLPNETVYYDPTKVLGDRECGLHTATSK